MIRRCLSIVLWAALLMPALAHAQVRDSLAAPTTGTASISGVVMSDASPSRPVRRVVVTLGTGGALKLPLASITDDNGAFVFPNLPAGAYTLVGSRPAWVSTAYGTKTYGRGSGVPITLSAGQQLTGVTLKMLHGSVIAGTVRDASGRPAEAEIIMMTVQTVNGRRKMTPVLQSITVDKRGEYRLFGLAPGDYILRAQPAPRMGVGDLRPTTSAELEWAKLAAAAQDAGAAGAPIDVPPPPANGRPVTYAPTYYPGTPDVTGATVITLGPNEERLGIDFATTMVPVASIAGRVLGPDGLPPRNASVVLQLAQTSSTSVIDQLIGGIGLGASGIRVGADGRLSGSGITPGRYRLIVRGAPGAPGGTPDRGAPALNLPGAAGAAAALGSMMAGAVGATLWATEDLDISGRDIEGLEIRLQPGLTLSGTIQFEGDDPQSPADASRVVITLNPAAREAKSALEALAGMFQGTMGGGKKDGTFSVAGIVPDAYRATFNPPGAVSPLMGLANPGGWVLKSAMLNGKDLADLPFDVRPGDDIKGVVVTFTKAVTQISGKVQDAAGRPVSGFPIVVFPTDRALWSPGARRILSAKPASNGTYSVNGLPAGEYYLCALTDLDPNDLYDSAFLDQLVAGSFKITLGDGEKKVQDLRLGGGH